MKGSAMDYVLLHFFSDCCLLSESLRSGVELRFPIHIPAGVERPRTLLADLLGDPTG